MEAVPHLARVVEACGRRLPSMFLGTTAPRRGRETHDFLENLNDCRRGLPRARKWRLWVIRELEPGALGKEV